MSGPVPPDRWFLPLVAIAGLAPAAAALWVWFGAPVERTMGVAQKIFYFHVPAAWGMYAATALCAGAAAVFLANRGEKAEALSAAAGSVALLLATVVLATGPFWARTAWGVYWSWEPRLTAVLVLWLILASHAVLRHAAARTPALARFAAALAVLGALDVPIIHVAVRKWRGNHPSVMGGGGGLEPAMALTLAVCLVAFTVLCVALVILRYRIERTRVEVSRLAVRPPLSFAAERPASGGR